MHIGSDACNIILISLSDYQAWILVCTNTVKVYEMK